MTTPLTDWGDALYLGAVTLWPDLTPDQFYAAANAFLDRHPDATLSLRDIANGVEGELRTRFGDPAKEDT